MAAADELSILLADVSNFDELVLEEFDEDAVLPNVDLIEPTRASVRKWPQDLKNQRKLKLHCKRMARFRNRKASKLQTMQEEHRHLEQKLQRLVAELTNAGVCRGESKANSEMQQLVLEREALREESTALHQRITQHLKFQQAIQSNGAMLKLPIHDNLSSNCDDVTVRCVNAEWKPVKEQAGRWVDFQSGAPPFFFHPFSRETFESILRRQEDRFADDTSTFRVAGKFLGWEVLHKPLIKQQHSDTLLGQSRYSKVLQCSIDTIQKAMCRTDGTNEWPIFPTSRGLLEIITIKTVQQFDDKSYVIVRDFPGSDATRYLGLVECGKWEEINGKRVLKYSFSIANSPANVRSHDAEPDQQNIRWIDDGGALLTLTEVNETSVYVEFTRWSSCKNEAHAQNHFIMFGHTVTRWEQLVSPLRLIFE